MLPPTASDIRAWAPPDFDWQAVGFPAPASGEPDTALEKRVEWAIGYVENTTGRPLATIAPPPSPALDVTNLVPVAEQAVLLATVQRVMQGSKRYLKASVLQDYIASFTAGSYSETRRRPDEQLGRGGISNPPVNPWIALSDLLYLLMTPDREAYWHQRLTGVTRPAGAIISQDFRGEWDVGHGWPATVEGSGIYNP
jgi:hypothetical protein